MPGVEVLLAIAIGAELVPILPPLLIKVMLGLTIDDPDPAVMPVPLSVMLIEVLAESTKFGPLFGPITVPAPLVVVTALPFKFSVVVVVFPMLEKAKPPAPADMLIVPPLVAIVPAKPGEV